MVGRHGTAIKLLLCALISILIQTRGECNVMRDCQRESRASWDSIRKLTAAKIDPNDLTFNLKCFVKCAMTKLGILNEKTELERQWFQQFPSNDYAMHSLGNCARIVGDNACDKAFEIGKCLFGPDGVIKNRDNMLPL